ncbi:MAG: hypothetical protein GC136_08345 [Alphaproteobacteria bacterium]|nr:hypothetical protein [Alphaproteobacteria bacterium]
MSNQDHPSRRHILQGALATGTVAALFGFSANDAEASASWPYAGQQGTCVIDSETGEVLVGENAFQRCYPASLTKVVTAMVVLDAIEAGEFSRGLDSRINPTRHGLSRARWDTPYAFKRMRASDSFTIREALHLVGGRSNNCLSTSLAEWTFDRLGLGTRSRRHFLQKMNEKADLIIREALAQARNFNMGPEFERAYPNRRPDTNFLNADGLNNEGPGQITNPWEFAHIMNYFYKNYREHAEEFFGSPTVDWPARGLRGIAVTHRLIPGNPAMNTSVDRSVYAFNQMDVDEENEEFGPEAPLSAETTFVIAQRMVKAGKTGYLRVSRNNLANVAEFNGRRVSGAVFGGHGAMSAVNRMSDALVTAYGINRDMLIRPDADYTPPPPPPPRQPLPELPQLY